MKLMTAALKKRFAQIGDQSETDNPLVIAKFFTPWSNWTWYATEFNPERGVFFGFVVGPFPEWGTFSLKELQEHKGKFGLKIERDTAFDDKPTPIKEIHFLKSIL